jgi:putative ABC transport system substrate-binding protein
LAIMANIDNLSAALELREVQAAARTLGFESVTLEVRTREDIVAAMEALKKRADALYVVIDGLTISNNTRINILALGAQVPTMYGRRDMLETGG